MTAAPTTSSRVGVPRGWYSVALSSELDTNGVVTAQFCDEEVVLFRTGAGAAIMIDAYCPHLGAHLGHGGKVEQDTIVCPFHGFRFDSAGTCTATGYGSRPPASLRTKVWQTVEQQGVIFAYHGHGAEPTWQLPTIDAAGWSEFDFHAWMVTSNPVDIAENSVDLGHFGFVHGYQDINITEPLETDGPFLSISYSINRKAPFTGQNIEVQFSIKQCGLGVAIVDTHTVEYDMRSRYLVMASPTQEGEVRLRVGQSLHNELRLANIHPALRVVPTRAVLPLIRKTYWKHFRADVTKDLPIWQNKKHIERPILAKGDGPIAQYRRWTEQFTVDDPADVEAAATHPLNAVAE